MKEINKDDTIKKFGTNFTMSKKQPTKKYITRKNKAMRNKGFVSVGVLFVI